MNQLEDNIESRSEYCPVISREFLLGIGAMSKDNFNGEQC